MSTVNSKTTRAELWGFTYIDDMNSIDFNFGYDILSAKDIKNIDVSEYVDDEGYVIDFERFVRYLVDNNMLQLN